jgi:hypothetical protein
MHVSSHGISFFGILAAYFFLIKLVGSGPMFWTIYNTIKVDVLLNEYYIIKWGTFSVSYSHHE